MYALSLVHDGTRDVGCAHIGAVRGDMVWLDMLGATCFGGGQVVSRGSPPPVLQGGVGGNKTYRSQILKVVAPLFFEVGACGWEGHWAVKWE